MSYQRKNRHSALVKKKNGQHNADRSKDVAKKLASIVFRELLREVIRQVWNLLNRSDF